MSQCCAGAHRPLAGCPHRHLRLAGTGQARAARSHRRALARMTEHPLVDAVVMARGGGSVQDLACFDDEGLCRAVFACELPVVCAIGHTDNNPVCNHVAWPAYTPSRSAELVVPWRRRNYATNRCRPWPSRRCFRPSFALFMGGAPGAHRSSALRLCGASEPALARYAKHAWARFRRDLGGLSDQP